MGRPLSLKTKILNHKLGDVEDAKSLYDELCAFLEEKYGLVDKDYDENPTKRGAEWLDIHHILEHELDDIAKRTQLLKAAVHKAVWVKENELFYKIDGKDIICYIKRNEDYEENYKTLMELKESFDKEISGGGFYIIDITHTLQDLKPYNLKKNLVYANKIEHFLLHYLIESMRGKEFTSGGPNYLWDAAVSLDLYGFDRNYLRTLQKNKKEFYSYLDVYILTSLYKQLIDWKSIDKRTFTAYWINFRSAMSKLENEKINYFRDLTKLRILLKKLGLGLNLSTINEIKSLPFMYKNCIYEGKPAKLINDHYFDLDGKTILRFSWKQIFSKKTFTIPNNVAKINKLSFPNNSLEKIIIPTSVKKIHRETFCSISPDCNKPVFSALKTIVYEGTQKEWESKFSNVNIKGIKLICQQ